MKRFLFVFGLAWLSFSTYAQLRLPAIYNDHMVLQQQAPVPIWGWSHPAQSITIRVSWDTTTIKTKSDNATYWGATLYTPVAGGPHTITIKAGGETRVLTDVMIGEVWLCSGQSNMEWSMEASGDGRQVMNEVNDPAIRLFHVPKSAASTLQVRGEGAWKVCDKESVRHFSAVAYFFAKRLQQELNVPVGLINASWGGTPAETWLPGEAVEKNAALKAAAAKQEEKSWWPSRPGVIYNSMLNPIVPFRLGGALWYQGESNTAAPQTYATLMENLVREWRGQFLSDFPFYYVQIAPFEGYGEVERGTLIREQQVKMLAIPNSGMVVTSDLVDNVKDIHPQFKKPVGERLANIALSKTFGKKGIAHQYPLYKEMKIEKTKVRILFDHASNGLIAKGGEPTEFLIAGEDKKFYPAKAKIEGATVVVSAKDVKKPVAVRFGWRNGSMPNLFSKEGLPVPSFRTDDWSIPGM